MATKFLDERLVKAADALLQHGERVQVRYCGVGEWRDCLLLGRGDKPGTVRLAIWCAAGEISKEANRPIVYTDVLLPLETQVRLEQVAREQDPPRTEEMARTLAFIGSSRQRRRSGQFADVTHRAEPKGCR